MSADALLPCTRTLMRELEDRSGRAVAVREDPSLALLATIQPATAASPVHLIRYRAGDSAPDYLIAYEIGFVLRMLARPPEARFQLGADERRRADVIAEMRRRMPDLDPARADELGAFLFDGLMRQLRSRALKTGRTTLASRRQHARLRRLSPAAPGSQRPPTRRGWVARAPALRYLWAPPSRCARLLTLSVNDCLGAGASRPARGHWSVVAIKRLTLGGNC